MADIKFKTIEELYHRLLPALRSKCKLLALDGYGYITENDIWNYMSLNVWSNSKGLELCDMVDNILNEDENVLVGYYREKKLNDRRPE